MEGIECRDKVINTSPTRFADWSSLSVIFFNTLTVKRF